MCWMVVKRGKSNAQGTSREQKYLQVSQEQVHEELQEEPKSELAKLSTKVWRTFRTWWDKNKKPESVLKKIKRHKQEVAEQPVNDKKVDRKKDQYRQLSSVSMAGA